jgi:uncharacterized protein DUF2721
MPTDTVAALSSAVAPIVMVSAAALLFNGVQAKNLHLSDRIRAVLTELRHPETAEARRGQLRVQLRLFDRRIRLSQWALDMIYVAMLCFMSTSLLLVFGVWFGAPIVSVATVALFAIGVAVLVVALALEFVELWMSLKTIHIEMQDVTPGE